MIKINSILHNVHRISKATTNGTPLLIMHARIPFLCLIFRILSYLIYCVIILNNYKKTEKVCLSHEPLLYKLKTTHFSGPNKDYLS